MKKNIFLYLIILISILFSSCGNSNKPGENIQIVEEQKIDIPEIDALLSYIDNSGDYINSKGVPNLLNADDIFENLGSDYIIDLRKHQDYILGHINGSVNIQIEDVIDYLDKYISASTYNRIVVTSYSGQSASYVTSILRLSGYNNVYAMKYGMTAWNKSLDKWSENISDKYINKLETKVNSKGKEMPYPKLNTGKSCGAEILEARAKTLLKTPFDKLKINADRAFSDSSFYVVNYWPEENYNLGHIPGAVQYTPRVDLKDSTFLKTLPTDKKILIYDFTGQNAAFTVAYLRLLGYNAFILDFGANSFMHKTLVDKIGWNGFVASEKINDFPLITGEEPSDKKINVAIKSNNEEKTQTKVVKRKKKEVEGGCG